MPSMDKEKLEQIKENLKKSLAAIRDAIEYLNQDEEGDHDEKTVQRVVSEGGPRQIIFDNRKDAIEKGTIGSKYYKGDKIVSRRK
jgi:hypothetical protein